MRDFSFHVGSYIAGSHCARGMSDVERQKLWGELLEEQGAPFGDEKVREFVDELIDFKKSHGKGQSLGGAIDMIAKRSSELLYISELDVGETVESCLTEMPVESESVCYLQPAHEFETCAVCEAPSSTAASCEGLDGFME